MIYLVRRAAAALVLIWLVLTLTFVLLHAAPGDAADLLVAPDALQEDSTLGDWIERAVRYAGSLPRKK